MVDIRMLSFHYITKPEANLIVLKKNYILQLNINLSDPCVLGMRNSEIVPRTFSMEYIFQLNILWWR